MSVFATTAWSDHEPYDWDVETLERSAGLVHVRRNARHISVEVADSRRGTDAPQLPGDPRWQAAATRARLSADGTVHVRSHLAPPALLISTSAARLLPSAPDVDETTAMTDDDLLVLCSASVLECLPAGFGTVLGSSTRPAAALDPAALLAELMADAEQGAAAVMRRVRRADSVRFGHPVSPAPRHLRTAARALSPALTQEDR